MLFGPQMWIVTCCLDRRKGRSVICFLNRRKAIALRSPCCAQARGSRPWLPVERMRSTRGGSGRNFPRFHPRRFGSCLAAVQPGPLHSASCFVRGPATTSCSGARHDVARPCPVVPRRAAHPASRGKPVICRRGKSRSTYTSRPCFARSRKQMEHFAWVRIARID